MIHHLQNILSPAKLVTCKVFIQVWNAARQAILCVLFIVLTLLTCTTGYSQKDDGIEDNPYIGNLRGATLINGATDLRSFIPGNQSSYAIKNIITFGIKEESTVYVSQNFTATVKVKIEYGHSLSALTNTEQILEVTYNKDEGVKYNAKNYFHFAGAEYVRITVNDITTSPAGINKDVLFLDNEMRVTRYYTLSANPADLQPSFYGITTPAPGADQLPVSWSWPPTAGYTHTQLEWTWVEDEFISDYKPGGGAIDDNLLFKNNSTRIDLPYGMLSYNIPLLYGGKGNVYFRVRAVNIKNAGSRADGPWSARQSAAFLGHNNLGGANMDSLNWQSTISFAEEGKMKAVVQYYDGSLRSRQTVTKDNTSNQTVVAETFYDGQGRPAMQILPAPGINTILSYTKNLNRFNATLDEDPSLYFDLTSKTLPNSFTDTLTKITGASKYYSSFNTEKNNGANAYIPDAEGHPYTLTRYTPDATGRIMAQSGAGAAMQMGRGHETKYYYGTPSQEELDALFGTEVGTASHYFKNMVRDANGQMSVSYVDMHGRTIATALAGEAPANLVGLLPNAAQYPNQAGRYMTQNLLVNGANTVKNNTIEAINTILVPARTAYNFRYELTPDKLQLLSCNATPICYDCMYNLEISITDEAGETAPVVKKYNNISLNADDNCATPVTAFKNDTTGVVSNIISFTQTLDAGSYIIRKTLTLAESSLQKYKNEYLAKALCKTEQELIDSVYSVMQTLSSCGANPPANTCTACNDSIGTYSAYRTKFLASLGSPGTVPAALDSAILSGYNAAKLNCDRLCNNTPQLLTTKRELMIADMVPYSGQYAKEIATGTTMYNKYDIFSTANAGQPFYKKPLNKNKVLDYYYDDFHVLDSSIHTNGTLSTLNNLAKDEFTDMFSYSWAASLLPYHPEYNKLIYTETYLKPSYNWINNFNNTTTYAQASANGFLISSAAMLTDSFYLLSTADKPAMVTKITSNYKQNLSMWQIAYGTARCKDIVATGPRDDCYKKAPLHPAATPVAPFDALTATEKNIVWNTFRSLYTNEREALVNAYLNLQVPIPDAQTLVNQNYILQFPVSNKMMAEQFNNNAPGDWSWYPATPGADPDLTGISSGTTAAQTYSSRCSSYINNWKQTLLQCDVLAAMANKEAIITEITTGMALVCEKGSNAANPYGSSNVTPGTPVNGSPRNFEDVINFVFNKYGIAKNSLCNPYVIEYPKPYGKGPAITKELITASDTCNCNAFSALKTAAIAGGRNPAVPASFNRYLDSVYHDTLTLVLYTAMMDNCSRLNTLGCVDSVYTKTINCEDPVPCYCEPAPACTGSTRVLSCIKRVCDITATSFTLPLPEPLPDFLKCGFSLQKKCISCAELSLLTKEFKDSIASPYDAGPVFSGTDLTAVNIRDNKLFAQFINYRTGFQKSWMDYAKAADAAGCNLANYLTNTGAGQNVICGDTKPLTDTTGVITTTSACEQVRLLAISLAQNIFKDRKEFLLANFETAYRAKCMAVSDSFTVSDTVKEYHYTLYYYDQAGNLVKTVPPKGVNPIIPSLLYNVRDKRAIDQDYLPSHTFATNYRYNSLNQVTAQTTPDAGRSNFWYDKLGRLVVSQNAQQYADNKYSYTKYDLLGRITEVGQKPHTTAMASNISQSPTALYDWIYTTGGTREQITYTQYDQYYGADLVPPQQVLAGLIIQQNLRNRVSYTYTKNLATDTWHYTASYYTYDIHGNVDTLVQDYKGVAETGTTDRFKMIAYDYDLISGKVNNVGYQPGKADAFYHRYQYDAENRLVTAETSRDKIVWEKDASYSYYKHGPLARTIIGAQQVQGMDYAYTLQGWLKGVNSTNLSTATDIGKDGYYTTAVSPVAKDVLGFSLHYYDATENGKDWIDYKAIGGTSAFARPGTGSNFVSLYNGNIGAISINNAGLLKGVAASTNALPLFYNYRYDQLNRLVSMQAYKGLRTLTNAWDSSFAAINDYKEAINYDPNGNILSYNRKGAPSVSKPLEMDDLTYNYYGSTNKLHYVQDGVSSSNYTEDIDNQSAGNYTYDAIGNLKSDAAESITNINWTVYGKIATITKSGSTISYTYDAAGNRVTKTANGKTSLYVRDAIGNVMAVYESSTGSTTALKPIETNLYGSSRLGIVGELTVMPSSFALTNGFGTAIISKFTRGEKIFELSSHTGNVLNTISDKKISVDGNGDGVIDLYKPDVISAGDYAPFGMQMVGRKYSSGSYRYGFNGKEQDKETSGTSTYDYGFRIYNPALGRFLSVDPLTKEYPELTPYQFTGNSPITFIDLDGLEMGWRNPVTGEVKAAGPLSLPTGSRNAEGWVLFIPAVRKTAANSPPPEPPVIKPMLQQSSGDLVSVKVKQNQDVAIRTKVIKPKVVQNVTTVSTDKRSYYEKQLSEEYAAGIERNKTIQNATMDQFAAQQIFMTANTGAEYVKGVAEHAEGVYNGINDGNYWSAAGNGVLLSFDVAPWVGLAGGSVAKGVSNLVKFGGDEAVIHFGKHADQIMKVTGKSAYNLKNYVDDANWIIQNGTYSSKLNGYYSFMANGSKGQSLFGFVGMKNGGSTISTFHIKSAAQLGLK